MKFVKKDVDGQIEAFLKFLKSNGKMEKLGTNYDNKTMSVHRWFSFMPGFSNVFVNTTFEFFNARENNYCVYDPFIGCGTTAVVGKNFGIKVVGNESNRFLYKISKAKTNTLKNPNSLKEVGDYLLKECLSKWRQTKVSSENTLLQRCYSRNNFRKLVSFRDIYFSNNIKLEYKPYIFLAISSLLPKCADVCISIPYLSWRHKRCAEEPFELFEKIIRMMKEDMIEVGNNRFNKNIKIYFQDSRKPNPKVKVNSVDLVFTSPPYLNNFDYGEALKIYTYFWKFTKNWSEITSKIREKSVVSATTYYLERKHKFNSPYDLLGKEMLAKAPKVSKKIAKIVKLIQLEKAKKRKKSFEILVALYFKDMLKVIQEIYRVLKKDGLSFMVIGDSAPYGVHIPTDRYLGEIALESGFQKFRIMTLRARGHRWTTLKNRHNLKLRESLLILRK